MRHRHHDRPCSECGGYGSVRVRSTNRTTRRLITIHCPACEGTGQEAK